jgi:hypothetical protein
MDGGIVLRVEQRSEVAREQLLQSGLSSTVR